MSYVYTVVIQMGGSHREQKDAVERLNEYLKEKNHLGGAFELIDSGKSAGTKFPERNLIWGGFNYLNQPEFIELFKSLKLDNSLLTIAHPEYELYTVVPSHNAEVEENVERG